MPSMDGGFGGSSKSGLFEATQAAACEAMLSLRILPHHSMQLPVFFPEESMKLPATSTVADLMNKTKEKFEELMAQKSVNKTLQINVLWNIKNQKKALNPNDKLSQCFDDGDTYGIYGDISRSASFSAGSAHGLLGPNVASGGSPLSAQA